MPETHMVAAADTENGKSCLIEPDLELIEELAHFGADTHGKCYQCATCSVACGLSPDENPFPRKEMLWAKWGLKDRLLKDLDIWTCYSCGDCSTRCPRKAEPGETMMALRRYLTSQYDWTGISRLLYTSRIREIGAVVALGLFVVVLFALSGAFSADRMPTDHVSVNTFMPVAWMHAFDLIMELDSKGWLLYASPNHRAVLGYDPDELTGRNAFELVHPDERQEVTRAFQGLLAGKIAGPDHGGILILVQAVTRLDEVHVGIQPDHVAIGGT